ncbi:MAG: hypothetical protein Q4P07_10850 [Ornithinimicrobium sp.]|uniref:hypothetical protein n=1 Tax=Ornithinimicrobium sp. TaxID=1977084 RepID=UPI0026E08D10|nr:hypothetical protein [Ornithinimicrobium sp.]MDO5740634.1 hypothetical protein [Ornithinimicrobium sp.]
MSSVFVAIVGPLLTAVLAGLGVLIKEWRTRRQWEHRRDEIIDQGRKQVAFISDWATAYGNLDVSSGDRSEPLRQAQQDLDALYRSVANQIDKTARQRPQRRGPEFYATWIFLTRVRRPWARVSRVFYLLALGWALFSGLIMALFSVNDDEYPLSAELAIAFSVTLVYLVPVALLHILTRNLDRPPGGIRAAKQPLLNHGEDHPVTEAAVGVDPPPTQGRSEVVHLDPLGAEFDPSSAGG